MTNPIERDKRLRIPVFIVSKEFVKGKTIKSGIGNPLSGLRPYSVFGSNGSIQQTKVNYTEIGHYANVTKDQAKMGIDRVVRQLSDKAKMVVFSLFPFNLGRPERDRGDGDPERGDLYGERGRLRRGL